MRYAIFTLIILLFPAVTTAMDSSDIYAECTKLTRERPKLALVMAREWIQRENVPSAYHCKAIAEFALEKFPESAKTLELLSERLPDDQLTLRANVLEQAARAWDLDNNRARAIIVITKAIKRTANAGLKDRVIGKLAANLLLYRSDLYLRGGRAMYALQDLDQGLMLSQHDEQLLIARSKLFIDLQEYDLAKQDLNLIINRKPGHKEANRLLNSIDD